jgi:hypothetical protein
MVVYIHRQGGLGNQLFQVAAGYAHAKKHGTILTVSSTTTPNRSDFNNSIFKNIPKINMSPSNCQQVYEPQFNYTPFPNNKSISLFGYFQSAKYFEEYRCDILRELTFTMPDIVSKYRTSDKVLVSLHVRRTDYAQLPDYHPLQTMEYYTSAMSYFPNAIFIVFSDDIRWCKENIKGDNIRYIEYNSGVSDDLNVLSDLYNMSLCDHHIIANSSFSWWGMYLNKNDTAKMVIAPQKWFGPACPVKNWQDIYPKNCIKL